MYLKGENIIKKERKNTVLFNLFSQIPVADVEIKGLSRFHKESELNSHGYRSEEFKPRKEFNVLSIGCEETFGFSIPKSHRYSDLFCGFINDNYRKEVANWNLGLPNKSNDYIARIITSAVPNLQPDLILIVFTDIRRREYWNKEGICTNYMPNVHYGDKKKVHLSERESWRSLANLENHNEDFINFYKNYLLIEAMLNGFGIPWLFSWTDVIPTDQTVMLNSVDLGKFVGAFGKYDTGKDEHHRGFKSHFKLADIFYEKFKEQNELQKLST